MVSRPILILGAIALASLTGACAHAPEPPANAPTASMSPAPGTYSLQSFASWRGYKSATMPKGWIIVDGAITKEDVAEDLVSRDVYGNFEFSLDWKLAPGGNAGIFYRGTEEEERIYWTGPEYQLLDDAGHGDGKNRLTAAASAYGLYAPPAGVVKPAGQWNTTRIVARGPHIEHWLNGTKVVEYELFSPDWEAKVKASKFGEWPKYGRAARGHIGIQGDHEGLLSLRNMQVTVFP